MIGHRFGRDAYPAFLHHKLVKLRREGRGNHLLEVGYVFFVHFTFFVSMCHKGIYVSWIFPSNFLDKILQVNKFYYNDLITNTLDLLKDSKENIKIKDVADEIGVKPKELYNIKNQTKIAGKDIFEAISKKYPSQAKAAMNSYSKADRSTSDDIIAEFLATQKYMREENERLKEELAILREGIRGAIDFLSEKAKEKGGEGILRELEKLL